MITTVTTTTITSLAVTASLAIMIVVSLLAILVSKEVIGSNSNTAQRIGRALNVAIVPLMLVFVVTALMKIAETLS